MPVIALKGLTVLPNMLIHFDISKKRSVAAVEDALRTNQGIFLVTQKVIDKDEPNIMDLYEIGTLAAVKQIVKMPGNKIRILVEGIEKGALKVLDTQSPILEGEIEIIKDEVKLLEQNVEEAYVRIIKEKLEKYAKLHGKPDNKTVSNINMQISLSLVLDQIAISIPCGYKDRQKILETINQEQKFITICDFLDRETNIEVIKQNIQNKVKSNIDKNQKEYVLREQLKVIREELGEGNVSSEADVFTEKLKHLNASEDIKTAIAKDINKLKGMSQGYPEANVQRNYIETLLSLPWETKSEDTKDFKFAAKILEKEHFGMFDVKERILEFLAVRKLADSESGSIICLAGPPGTGKSSIAKSVAKALGKEYVRISLGGIRDEAEIRGHRKTYIGAMSGRIIEALKRVKVKNPVILLDEIDKLSSDIKGDTAAALLEVLDADQNKEFRDHYVELPVDLSEVLFIATANNIQTISKPLLDRLEIIEVSSYTENEKFHIANDYLINNQKTKNGIDNKQLTFNTKAIEKIIHNYTREAGVRNLERSIGKICRKVAREIVENEVKKVSITTKNLSDYLGKEKLTFIKANDKDEVGIVRGLAWTSVGGDTLQIEVNIVAGKGVLKLTGNLGNVMKESAEIAISYARSVAEQYGIKSEFFEKNDVHIHIPEGAIPKDGPSAGITMATAILSAITNTKVSAKVAMTGEVTLRGRVLPIGGLKEKVLAAKKADIKTVIVPYANIPDIEELSEEITDGLNIVYAKTIKDVLECALVVK